MFLCVCVCVCVCASHVERKVKVSIYFFEIKVCEREGEKREKIYTLDSEDLEIYTFRYNLALRTALPQRVIERPYRNSL